MLPMGKKIAVVVLEHACDENPCHLDNNSQARWIKNAMPLDKIKWNWNLYKVTVYDLTGKEERDIVAEFLENEEEEEAE